MSRQVFGLESQAATVFSEAEQVVAEFLGHGLFVAGGHGGLEFGPFAQAGFAHGRVVGQVKPERAALEWMR